MSSKHAKISRGITFKGITSYPSDPQNGDIVYRSDLDQLLFYKNSQWNSLGGSGPVAYTRGSTDLTDTAANVDTIGNLPAITGDGISSELDYSVAMTDTNSNVKYQTGSIIAWKGNGVNWDYTHTFNIAVDIGFRLSITSAGIIQYIAPVATIGSITALKIRVTK